MTSVGVADAAGEGATVSIFPALHAPSKIIRKTPEAFLKFIVFPSDPSSLSLLSNRPSISPEVLCLVERRISPAEKCFPSFFMDSVLGNPNTDRDCNLLFTRLNAQRPHELTETFCLFRGSFKRAMWQDDQKLLAAVAPDRIGITDVLPQLACQI